MPEVTNGSPALSAVVEDVLKQHGSMDPKALAAALAERGYDLGPNPEEFLLDEVLEDDDTSFMPLADDRWCHLPSLLLGRVFTHRVTELELEHDLLAVAPDLEPLLMVSDDPAYQQLTDGTPLRVVLPHIEKAQPDDRSVPAEALDESGSLLLVHGTCKDLGVSNGDLVGLRLTPDGVECVHADGAPAPQLTTSLRDRVIDLLQRRPGHPLTIEILVYSLLADEPAAFMDPLPPLQELLAAWDLPTAGDLVGAPGFDFARWRTDRRLAQLRQRYELTEDQALVVSWLGRMHESVLDVMEAYTSLQDSGSTAALEQVMTAISSASSAPTDRDDERQRPSIKALLPLLAEPAVAQAVLRETCMQGHHDAVALAMVAETLEPQVDRGARPALRWLRAKAQEELGDIDAAEQSLHAAERLDPAWAPTLVDLARYAADRGNSAAGLALLRRAGDDVAPLLRGVLEQYRPAPGRMMPRNELCWCGSGRKFKQCHLRQADRLPLPERAGWLYQKAVLHVLSTTWVNLANELAFLRTAYAETDREASALIADGLIQDVALFEGGALAEFVETRGRLLPRDELLLAHQWLLTERSVFDVTAVSAGASLTLRDVRTGDVAEVPERTASRTLRPGQLICTHLLSVGDGVAIFGGVEPIGLHERDALVELLDGQPDPEDIVEFCTRRFAPPTLVNTEGDPLVLCKAELRINDPGALAAALDDTYRREEANPHEPSVAEWVETKTINGLDRLTASLRLTGAQLTITTNSEPRLDAALASVRSLGPSLELTSQQRTPMGDARAAARFAETIPASSRDSAAALNDLPEVRAAVAQHIRTYEEQWLDLPIPALAGSTPRDAANDPTRRDDLIRLLATSPETDDPTAMSPCRLRTALGLPSM